MPKRNLLSQRKYLVFISVAIVIVLLVVCSSYFIHQRTNQASAPPVLETHELSGKVTRIQTSCSDKMLSKNGEVAPGPSDGMCDGGSFVYINNQPVHTASGLTTRDKMFSVDIDFVKLGDQATVKYADSENGSKTLNCSRCSIVVR